MRAPLDHHRDGSPLGPARGIALGLAASVPLWAMLIVGAVMLGGFKIGLDQSVATAKARQEIDAPLTIRTASAGQRELAR